MPGQRPLKQTLNFWAMLNNVLIASLAKGQFLTSLLFLTFIAMIFRMPPEDVSRLMFTVIADLENGKLLGYLLGILTTGAWYLHAKRQRRAFEREMARMAETRDEMQGETMPGLLESSEGKKQKKVKKQ